MNNTPLTHIAFSDDSAHESGVYNSLCVVSAELDDYKQLLSSFKQILKDSNIKKEFKWTKLKTAKYRFAAEKIINFVFNNNNKIRIDIIVWDLSDLRHNNIKNRNDSENLVRMYYHLLSTVTSKRWPINTVYWNWYPDRQSGVDWSILKDCINNKKKHNSIKDIFNITPLFEQVNINKIIPSDSQEKTFIQLADFFAGIAAYSFGQFTRYKKWKDLNSRQQKLFEAEIIIDDFSKSEKERFHIIEILNTKCKKNSLQIAFNSTKGFYSHNPERFLNFWLYQPQHALDKAPTKVKKC